MGLEATREIRDLDSSPGTLKDAGGEGKMTTPGGLSPGARIGRFEIICFVGSGGMALVYKARDPDLDRVVALKVLRAEDTRMGVRLMNEARAQARIEHDNICRVHEVGEADGRRFIAMQFVDGMTLAEAAADMTLQDKVRMMMKAAEAVHAAHRIGLIHRDLKPTNIMVERLDDGTWKPYVMDFGLVRELDAPGMTTTGVVIGTPAYMPPEQASGTWGDVDVRSDVYGLGATLYETLIGRPMFDGNPLSILRSVAEQDPQSLRRIDLRIPLDIETIVMKCVEKEPARRYQSAKALADELRRFIDGEPIQARRSSLWHRLGKKARRHKALVGVAGAALTVILALIGIGVYSWWKAGVLRDYSLSYGQRAKEIEPTMRTAYMRPLHDIRAERARVLGLLRQIDERMKRDGQLATGAGNCALGKGLLFLHDYDKAHECLMKSWNSGYREADLGYNLATALGALYARALQKAQRAGSLEYRQKATEEARSKYRDPAMEYMRAEEGLPGLPTEYIEGLIALYEGRYDTAIARATHVAVEHPWLAEAQKLKGDASALRGWIRYNAGDHKACISDLNIAVESYRTCQETLRSDPEIYDAEAQTWEQVLYADYMMGKGNKEALDHALQSCDRSIAIDPDRASPFTRKSAVLWKWAQFQAEAEQDCMEYALRAQEQAETAIRLDPQSAEAHSHLGAALHFQASDTAQHGGDASPYWEPSIVSARRALELEPNDPLLLYRLGNIMRLFAEHEVTIGVNPSSHLSESVRTIQRATEEDPMNRGNFLGLGHSFALQADYEAEQGRDPRVKIAQSDAAYGEALRLSPGFSYAIAHIGANSMRTAWLALAIGDDPNLSIERARSLLQQAVTSSPILPEVYLRTIDMHVCKAIWRLQNNHDPQESLDAGRMTLAKLLKLAPKAYEPQECAARLETVAARWAMKRRLSPDRFFQSAVDHLDKALELNSLDRGLYATMASVYRWEAEDDLSRGASPETAIGGGLAAADRCMAGHRKPWEALAISGTLELQRARARSNPQNKAECARSAAEKLDRAIENSFLLKREYGPLLEEARRMAGSL